MQRTRLAAVSYLNTLPLIWGLTHGRHRDAFDLVLAPPCDCARLLQDGLVDVALIPSFEFARAAGLIAIPGTGISSRQEVRSVLLLTRREPTGIRSLAVDLNSRTSVALTRLILSRRYGSRPRVEAMPPDPASMFERHDAALVIGDAALRVSTAGWIDPHTGTPVAAIDLAGQWHEMTGMPFVFAIWACRPVVQVAQTKQILDDSLSEGMRNIETIAREHAGRASLPADVIASYLTRNIHYTLGPEESDSLRVFFRMCREDGILPGGQARAASPESSSATLNRG